MIQRYMSCYSIAMEVCTEGDYVLYTDHLAALAERNETVHKFAEIDADYQKIVSEILECNPIPASLRIDDRLEPPWEVVRRIRLSLAEKDKQIAALTTERDLMKKCLFPEQLKIIQSNLKALRGEEE